MRFVTTLLVAVSMILVSLPTYAFQVKVTSMASGIEGIGFTTKGKNYGGMGKSYSKSGMAKGSYTFGMRKNGKDIGCKDEGGHKNIQLTRNASVMLNLKGNHCIITKGQK
jgi:hypothetical protein